MPTSEGDKVAKEIGENATFIPANVTSEEDVQNVMAEIEKKHKRLDVVVNCAGIAQVAKVYNFNTKKPLPLEDIDALLTVCWWNISTNV